MPHMGMVRTYQDVQKYRKYGDNSYCILNMNKELMCNNGYYEDIGFRISDTHTEDHSCMTKINRNL